MSVCDWDVDYREIEAPPSRSSRLCHRRAEEGSCGINAVGAPFHELRDHRITGVGMHRALVSYDELTQHQSVA